MFQRSWLWGALWTRGAYERGKLWSFWSQKETTIMTIDPWLGRKSDEEVEDMEKPNSERWRTSNSHLEMISSDCCFQQSPAKLGWWTRCYDPPRSQHRGPCSLVTGDLMSYSRLYQYGKSDELRKRWGGWWCPLEDAPSFTETIFAAVAELRWGPSNLPKHAQGLWNYHRISVTIFHYHYPRKSSSDDSCEQPDRRGDGSPGNRGSVLIHVTMMLMIIMKKKMFMNLATNQVNKALGHHSNVDDHHAEENVDAPDAQPGGALLPNRWPAMVFLPLALTNQGQAVCYPGLTIVIFVLSRSHHHHHSQ